MNVHCRQRLEKAWAKGKCVYSVAIVSLWLVMVKMDSPKLVPMEQIFLINTDPPEVSTAKIWTPSEKFGPPPTDERTQTLNTVSLAKLGPMAYLGGFRGFWKLLRSVSSATRNVL